MLANFDGLVIYLVDAVLAVWFDSLVYLCGWGWWCCLVQFGGSCLGCVIVASGVSCGLFGFVLDLSSFGW